MGNSKFILKVINQ